MKAPKCAALPVYALPLGVLAVSLWACAAPKTPPAAPLAQSPRPVDLPDPEPPLAKSPQEPRASAPPVAAAPQSNDSSTPPTSELGSPASPAAAEAPRPAEIPPAPLSRDAELERAAIVAIHAGDYESAKEKLDELMARPEGDRALELLSSQRTDEALEHLDAAVKRL